ncbi:MAG: cation-transporting P-type ATPase [Candidatus Colwellbacteria bacterium]|nr:cation-transporting P-type ATPase [Candidatus Colwellbacteria bacterium]
MTYVAKPYWAMPVEDVFVALGSGENGLDESAAKERIKEYGKNILPKGHRATKFEILAEQFKSPLIIVLFFAGVAALFFGDYKGGGFIFAAIFVNTILGFYQENKAETALASLESYIKERVRVIRGGREIEIDSEEVVPGDLIRLFPGARVPADARLVKINELGVDEGVLTGESMPDMEKTVEPCREDSNLLARNSMVFAGTLVAEGLGLAVVTLIGKNTEFGKIAEAVTAKEHSKTPLQTAIQKFTMKASLVLTLLTALLFVVGLFMGFDLFQMFLIAIALAVFAVPEGLPVALTVILAVGVERLVRKKGVIRKLLATETLGSTTVIMTDKTGTLTEAKMSVSEIISKKPKDKVLELALLNTDVVVENPDAPSTEWRIIGKPFEEAILRAALTHQVLLDGFRPKLKILDRHPFNSTNKFGATQIEIGDKKLWNYMGAPEILLAKTDLKREEKDQLLRQVEELASSGKRVLSIVLGHEFMGFIAFSDPVRATVKDEIERVGAAGVRTIIVTGDHKGTALAVAKEIGLQVKEDQVLLGEEVRAMSDDVLRNRLDFVKIYARVSPEDKLRISQLFREKGEVVAMAGDGVNDAPALKQADIGIAVGSGTDVAKSAADLIMLDDNFGIIVAAIEEGRRTLENIKKVIVYMFSNVLDGIILIGGSLLLALPLPMNPLQILWVNFFQDSFPAIALAFENGKDHLKDKPSSLKGGLFDPLMRFIVIVVGTSTSVALLIMYFMLITLGFEEPTVRTFIFTTFSIYTLIFVFALRNLNISIFRYNPFSNKYLNIATLIGFGLTALAVYLPALQKLFNTVPLAPIWIFAAIGFGLLSVLFVEFVKWLFRKRIA